MTKAANMVSPFAKESFGTSGSGVLPYWVCDLGSRVSFPIFFVNHAIPSSSPSERYYIPSPSLNIMAQRMIGERGFQRFQIFRKAGKDFDNSNTRRLNEASINTLNKFAEALPSLNTEVSLFLTPLGNLSIIVMDKFDKTMEFEFGDDEIHYYLEREDEEGLIDVKNIRQLVSRLNIA